MPTTEEATTIFATQTFVTYNLQELEIISIDFENISTSDGIQYADFVVHITNEAIERLEEEGNWFPVFNPQDYLYQRLDYDEALATITKIEDMDVVDRPELDERFDKWVAGGI